MTPRRLTCLLLAACVLSGCAVSFRSAQFDVLRAMVSSGGSADEAELAEQAWTLEWSGEEAVVYPVIVGENVVFANAGGVEVHFDGWQVRRTVGLLPRGRVSRIEGTLPDLSVIEDDVVILRVSCSEWRESQAGDGARVLTQRCEGIDDDNRIVVDGSGNTSRLRFVVHPGYPPLELSRGAEVVGR